MHDRLANERRTIIETYIENTKACRDDLVVDEACRANDIIVSGEVGRGTSYAPSQAVMLAAQVLQRMRKGYDIVIGNDDIEIPETEGSDATSGEDDMIGIAEVERITRHHRSTINRKIEAGQFPPPIQHGEHAHRYWKRSLILLWKAGKWKAGTGKPRGPRRHRWGRKGK